MKIIRKRNDELGECRDCEVPLQADERKRCSGCQDRHLWDLHEDSRFEAHMDRVRGIS